MLNDSHGRKLNYLRLSLIDKCNYRCFYCNPSDISDNNCETFLNRQEINNLAKTFGQLGVKKIRLTGGEPTLRSDILEIVRGLSALAYFDKIALTTNGFRLKHLAEDLKDAGLNAVNISLDTLEREKFRIITGEDNFEQVLEGIHACVALGIETKVNAVLMKGVNDNSIDSFLNLIKHLPISMRFIEFMKTETNHEQFEKHHLPIKVLKSKMEALGWKAQKSVSTDGPAEVFVHQDFIGTIGFISPYTQKFCSDCNRVRVDSRGKIRMCLFGKSDVNIRELLQSESMIPKLQKTIIDMMESKPKEHNLEAGDFGSTKDLMSIGG